MTPGAIEELSHQIESLIERGRKLRELKSSISTSPGKSILETRKRIVDPLATLPASVQLFEPWATSSDLGSHLNEALIEQPRVPKLPAEQPTRKEVSAGITTLPIPKPCEPRIKQGPQNFDVSVSSIQSYSVDRERILVKLRTSDHSGSTVRVSQGQEVSIEIWEKQSQDLLAMGRFSSNCEPLNVDCFGVWDGALFCQVSIQTPTTQEIETPELEASIPPVPIVLESSVEEPRAASITYMPQGSLDEFLISRSRPSPAKSVASVVSFLSNSPQDRLEVSSDEEIIISPSSHRLQERAKSYVLAINSRIEEHSCDPRTALMQQMKELDALTSRLNGEKLPQSPLRLSDESPIDSATCFVPPPDFTMLLSAPQVNQPSEQTIVSSRKPRRKRLGSRSLVRRRRRRGVSQTYGPEFLTTKTEEKESSFGCFLNPPVERSNSVSQIQIDESSMLSIVSCPQVLIPSPLPREASRDIPEKRVFEGISAQRQKSIERARQNISTLRGSLLKDADRISAILKSTGQIDDEESS